MRTLDLYVIYRGHQVPTKVILTRPTISSDEKLKLVAMEKHMAGVEADDINKQCG